MAQTKKRGYVDYREHLERLRREGPARLYVLRGEEEYLRESFLQALRGACAPEGEGSFNLRRIDGPKPDLDALTDAAEAMPFLGERTFCEIRGFDLNKTRDYDAERFTSIISDVPDWCTLAFVFAPDYAPDGRLSPVKALNKRAVTAEFTRQSENDLCSWLHRHFKEYGKSIDRRTAEHMLYMCGSLMNTLLPEIAKVAGYARGEAVTEADIDAVARRTPETTVFQLTDALGLKKYDAAAGLLAELLSDRDENPQKLLYMISDQTRRLYAARAAVDCLPERERSAYLGECIPELAGLEFLRRKLLDAAKNFSLARLGRAVVLCVDCEKAMKSSAARGEDLLKELLLAMAMDKNDAAD